MTVDEVDDVRRRTLVFGASGRKGERRHSFAPGLSLRRVGASLRPGGTIMSGSRRSPGRLGPYVGGYRARLLELGIRRGRDAFARGVGPLGPMDGAVTSTRSGSTARSASVPRRSCPSVRAAAVGGRDAGAGLLAECGRPGRNQRDAARRFTSSSTSTGVGWRLSGALAGHRRGYTRLASRFLARASLGRR